MRQGDPVDSATLLARNKSAMERYRSAFGMPDVSSYPSVNYPTVCGRLALIYAEWCEWEFAVEFANYALQARDDPTAQKAMIQAATESQNETAIHAVKNMRVSDKTSLLYIDLLIAQGEDDEALATLESLEISETTSEFGTSPLSWVHLTNRFLLIAMHKGNTAAFDDRLNVAWNRYFTSDEDFDTFRQKIRSGAGNNMQWSLTLAARYMSIIAYQKFRDDGNSKEATRWRERARLLAEAIVAANPMFDLHYKRVIMPKLK